MTFDPQAMIRYAKSWVGFHEGAQNRNPFTLWQTGFTSTQPWCDSFCCNCAYQGGGYRFPSYSLFGQKGDWNVGAHHQHAIRQGIWRDRSYLAQPGDLVVLNFSEPDQHIEIVLSDMGHNRFPRVITVGGNTGDMVAYRSRYEANIGGFIALTLDAHVPIPIPPPPIPIPPTPPKKKVKKVFFFFQCIDAGTEEGKKVIYTCDGIHYNPTVGTQYYALKFLAAMQGYNTDIVYLTKAQIGHMVRVENPLIGS